MNKHFLPTLVFEWKKLHVVQRAPKFSVSSIGTSTVSPVLYTCLASVMLLCAHQDTSRHANLYCQTLVERAWIPELIHEQRDK